MQTTSRRTVRLRLSCLETYNEVSGVMHKGRPVLVPFTILTPANAKTLVPTAGVTVDSAEAKTAPGALLPLSA